MPELPEVEVICRRLRKEVCGNEIASAQVLRPRVSAPQPPREIESFVAGCRIERIERRGKNILIALSGGLTIHIHLRMTGNLYVIPDARLQLAGLSALFEFPDGRALVFEDRRGLGILRLYDARQTATLWESLGLEPLSRAFTAEAFVRAAKSSRYPAKMFLMDQRRVAGLGNIYAAEALFRAGVHPRRRIGSLSARRLRTLHAAIVRTLRDAVRSAWIEYSGRARFAEAGLQPAVYGRAGEPCHACQRAIRRIVQGGRPTYYCPGCQR